MKQYRVTASMFNPKGNNPGVPDAYVDPADLKAAGVYTTVAQPVPAPNPQLPNLGKYQADHNVQPGTDAWFKLWFSRPTLTGEKPHE
jgi:hypothetical protein